MTHKLIPIEKILIKFFSRPFEITNETVAFFESVYGAYALDDIKNILDSEPHLLNLIISPDKNLLKEIIPACPLNISKEDVMSLFQSLIDNIQTVKIKLKDQTVTFSPSKTFFKEFISKLKLDVEIPVAIYNVIKTFDLDTYVEILMELKKYPISWNPNMESFFEMFFLKFKENRELVLYLKTLLSLFQKNLSVSDIKDAILKRIHTLNEALQNLISTKDKIDNKGLEFVLTSRIPLLCISSDEIHRELKILEDIFFNLFPGSI